MAQLNYEIPDDLHRILKSEAAIRGLTLKAYIIQILREAHYVPEPEVENV